MGSSCSPRRGILLKDEVLLQDLNLEDLGEAMKKASFTSKVDDLACAIYANLASGYLKAPRTHVFKSSSILKDLVTSVEVLNFN